MQEHHSKQSRNVEQSIKLHVDFIVNDAFSSSKQKVACEACLAMVCQVFGLNIELMSDFLGDVPRLCHIRRPEDAFLHWFDPQQVFRSADASMHNCREKFLEGVKAPLVSGQLVHMYYQDAVDPSQGKWYSGRVVKQQPFDCSRPSCLWEGVEVSWEDGSEC